MALPIPLLVVLGLFSLTILLVTLAAWFEDLDSDVGSQNNPNSQVQLAPQVGHLHRIFNKAISGEPISHALWGLIASSFFTVLWSGFKVSPLIALPIASGLTTLFQMTFATTAHLGRTTSLNVFGQPLYMDVLIIQLPLIAAYGFVCSTAYTTVSYLSYSLAFSSLGTYLGYPLPLPILGFMYGILAGSAGASTGDIHYGSERQFQHTPFGQGVAMKDYGNITIKAEVGYRTSSDVVYFCAKLGGPVSGFCFGLLILFDNFRLVVGNFAESVIVSIAIGVVILALLVLVNRWVEVWSRRKFGPYEM